MSILAEVASCILYTMSGTVKDVEDLPPEEIAPANTPGLLVVASGQTPHLLPMLLPGGRVELGRDELGSLRIPDDRVSKRHLLVELTPKGARLRDCGSTNGVFVNGERIAGELTVSVSAPQVLRIGRTLLLLVSDLRKYQAAQGRPLDNDGIVAGPALQAAYRQITALARAGQNLFIRGESGVGKELAARVYHETGVNHHGKLVAVNCATIPRELAERLLFGAVRGAYSGAVADAAGYLQAASGGTLFLDEVAELDMAVQAKLLRALETCTVIPLGATSPQHIDLKLCAATLRDLRAAVAAGSFRQDLYYRICRPEVYLPPLRERLEEIPSLVALALQKASRLEPSPSLLEACLLRPWPGNVRELCAEVRAAAALAEADGSKLVLDRHLSAQAGLPLARPEAAPAAAPAGSPAAVDESQLRAAAEALGLATRTARKLLPAEQLAALQRRVEQEGMNAAARNTALRACAAEVLLELLEARDFQQSAVAAELGISRTTMLKLSEALALPRAADLDANAIARARAQAGGDLEGTARLLRVSPTALRMRLAALPQREPPKRRER